KPSRKIRSGVISNAISNLLIGKSSCVPSWTRYHGRVRCPAQGVSTMQRQVRLLVSCLATVLVLAAARADGPGDNVVDKVRRVPKAGIEVPDTDRTELQSGLDALTSSIQTLRGHTDPKIVELLPDVIIFQKAIHDALTYHEFFAPGDIAKAKRLLTV